MIAGIPLRAQEKWQEGQRKGNGKNGGSLKKSRNDGGRGPTGLYLRPVRPVRSVSSAGDSSDASDGTDARGIPGRVGWDSWHRRLSIAAGTKISTPPQDYRAVEAWR